MLSLCSLRRWPACLLQPSSPSGAHALLRACWASRLRWPLFGHHVSITAVWVAGARSGPPLSPPTPRPETRGRKALLQGCLPCTLPSCGRPCLPLSCAPTPQLCSRQAGILLPLTLPGSHLPRSRMSVSRPFELRARCERAWDRLRQAETPGTSIAW